MIELLILYELSKKTLTMYGISREIRTEFSMLTTPSFGTIKPALNRMALGGFIKTQKTMSQGGRPSTFYSITRDGEKELRRLMISEPLENPIQFLPNARVRLYCSEILATNEQREMFKLLKQKSESIMLDTMNVQESSNLDFFGKMVFDNLICEYKNFINLLEGFERACKN